MISGLLPFAFKIRQFVYTRKYGKNNECLVRPFLDKFYDEIIEKIGLKAPGNSVFLRLLAFHHSPLKQKKTLWTLASEPGNSVLTYFRHMVELQGQVIHGTTPPVMWSTMTSGVLRCLEKVWDCGKAWQTKVGFSWYV